MIRSKDILSISKLYVCNLKSMEVLKEYDPDQKFIIYKQVHDMNYDNPRRYTNLYYEALTREPIKSYITAKPIKEKEHEEVMYNFEKIDKSYFTEKELKIGYVTAIRLIMIYCELNNEKHKVRNR